MNDNMTNNKTLDKYIDLAKWENNDDNHYHWQGEIALQDFPRLIELADDTHDNSESLKVELSVKKNGDVIMWRLTTTGTLWQTCQRCLEPVATSLNTESEMALLTKESHVGLLDEDTEFLFVNELTDDNRLYLLAMIEDELLVDLPLSSKHDDCEMAVSQVGEFVADVEEKDNPFAVLAGLKLS